MLDLLLAAWLETATIREMPGDPPLVLVVGKEIPERVGWPKLARTAACRAFPGEVLTYLLVEVPSEYGVGIPIRVLPRDRSLSGRGRGPQLIPTSDCRSASA